MLANNATVRSGKAKSLTINFSITFCFSFEVIWCCLADQGSPSVMHHAVSVESSSLLIVIYLFTVVIH